MLLPSAFQDKDIPTTLGKKVERPAPAQPDPIREFERHNHDKPTQFVPRLPRVIPLPDVYLEAAKQELKRQWEENRARRQPPSPGMEWDIRIDDWITKEEADKGRAQRAAFYEQQRVRNERLDRFAEEQKKLGEAAWDAYIKRNPRLSERVDQRIVELREELCGIPSSPLQWPKIDASAVPVGQSLFIYGVEK